MSLRLLIRLQLILLLLILLLLALPSLRSALLLNSPLVLTTRDGSPTRVIAKRFISVVGQRLKRMWFGIHVSSLGSRARNSNDYNYSLCRCNLFKRSTALFRILLFWPELRAVSHPRRSQTGSNPPGLGRDLIFLRYRLGASKRLRLRNGCKEAVRGS